MVKKIADMITHFDTIHERGRERDGQTSHDGVASRGKN